MIESRQDLANYLAADLAAYGLPRWRPLSHRLSQRTLHFQRLLRHWEYYANVRHDPVGRDCRIHQVVTIGEANGRAPRLGDGVHLSPHTAVIGGLTIGDRVGVRTGAVVVGDVPADVDVAGVPARVVGTP